LHLIQILVPLFDNDGNRLSGEVFRAIRAELVTQFGGLTAFTRAPAEGLWATEDKVSHDEIMIFEVMAERVELEWWRSYRRTLEMRLRQEVVVIRHHQIDVI
jgi:hypothetical protein